MCIVVPACKKGSFSLDYVAVLSLLSHLLVLICKHFWSGIIIFILLFNSLHMLCKILNRDNLWLAEFAFRKTN